MTDNCTLARTLTGPFSSSESIVLGLPMLPENIERRFHIIKTLGKGSFGNVYFVVERESNKEFAMKHVRKTISPIPHDCVDFEMKIVKELTHDNIIHCFEVINYDLEVFMFFDVMKGGNLFELLDREGNLPEELAKFYFKQLCSAIQYIHGKNIVHCDIKPENLLRQEDVERPILKLCDFGLSRKFDSNTPTYTKAGTLIYASPELLRSEQMSPKADVWSAGVTLFVLLCASFPFKGAASICSGVFNFDSENFRDVSISAKRLIEKMLVVEIETRLTIEEVLSIDWLE